MSDPVLQREFWAAIGAGDSGRVRELVAAGAEPNLPGSGPGSETPLIRAVTTGDITMVKLLVELGADVNLPWKGPKSWTPLMFAHDHPEMLQLLIDAGANLESRAASDWIRSPGGRQVLRPGGQTVLHLAALDGNAEAVRILVRAGADVEARADDGCAPLDYAIRLGASTEAAEALIESGAKLTPERLETMHASAHDAESDLVNFPLPTDAAAAGPPAADLAKRIDQLPPTGNPPELRCPNCHALMYSRKTKICGQCGALLPPELTLTDAQVQSLDDQRRWARELADKFSTRPSKPHPAAAQPTPAVRYVQPTNQEVVSPAELLRHLSCVDEFRRRPRPTFWLYVVGYGLSLFLMVFLVLKLNLLAPEFLLFATVAFFLLCFRAWLNDSPFCPNCKQNIRFCAASFCHGCGEALRNQRCPACNLDNSWINIFRPYSNRSNYVRIAFCPGCGVRLNSWIRRWGYWRG